MIQDMAGRYGVSKAIKSQVASLYLNVTPTNEQCDYIIEALQDAEVFIEGFKASRQ